MGGGWLVLVELKGRWEKQLESEFKMLDWEINATSEGPPV